MTLSNNVTLTFARACYVKQSSTYRISLKTEEKFGKCNKKVYEYLSDLECRLQYCLWNLRIACKAVQVAIPLRELKLKFISGANIYKSFYHLRSLYSPRTIQPHCCEPNLSWCNGTFNSLEWNAFDPSFIFHHKDWIIFGQICTVLVRLFIGFGS